MKLYTTGHAYGQSAYHFVFVPKYRRPIFNDSETKQCCEYILIKICREHNFTIHALQIERDHVHLFVSIKHTYSVSYAVQLLKGSSSRFIRQNCPQIVGYLWGKHLWSAGLFYRSVGNVTADTIQHYITESQGKPKVEFDPSLHRIR